MSNNNKQTSFYYTYEIKQNPLNQKCKIMKIKKDRKTDKVTGYATAYKNLTLEEANEHKYFLDRGKEPI